MSALSGQDALQRLYRRNLTPLALKPVASRAPRLTVVAARDLTRTIAQLLRSGLSFSQALRFASEELEPGAAAIAARMHEAAEDGLPASEALQAFDGAEARLLRGVIAAGETSGRLADALEVASASFARSADLRARAGAAMIYPAFVILATLATLACFLLLVVPTLAQAFHGAEDRLPAETRTLLALSAWLRANGALSVSILAAILAAAFVNKSARAALGGVLDYALASRFTLGIPQRLDFAAFATLAALSLSAGVPSVNAFDAAAQAVRNTIFRARLTQALSAMRTGERASDAMAKAGAGPVTLLRLMRLGEETGKLADAMRNAGAILAAEAEHRLARLGAIAGPMITLGLGALVASIVMSLFLGLLALSELAAA